MHENFHTKHSVFTAPDGCAPLLHIMSIQPPNKAIKRLINLQRERERQKQRQRETKTEKETETDRQTNRGRGTDRQWKDKQA